MYKPTGLRMQRCAMFLLLMTSFLTSGCLDLALIGMNAAIRDSQNKERIRQEQQIDAQRQQRDFELRQQNIQLQRQNEELLRQRE